MKTFLVVLGILVAAVSIHAQCPTADDVVVQNALDSAAAAGGGTVQLDARVYNICQALLVGSNVHLRGSGRGATIIRGAVPIPTCKVQSDALVCASVGAVATNNTSVSDLTIDNRTNNCHANGVEFVPAGSSYEGQVPTNGLVERVEVLGPPGLHAYQIWNLRGQHMKIVDNWVDGGSTANSSQEGIETFGGYDVVIANNTIRNIGTACVMVGSAGLANSETVGVIVANNHLDNCQMGVFVTTSNLSGDQYNAETHVRGNMITNSRLIGIDVWVMSSTHLRNLLISHNTIRDVSAPDQAAGIRLIPNDSIDAGSVLSTTVENNLISGIHGLHGHGIRIVSYPNARILHNTIADTDDVGIFALDTRALEVVGNRLERTGSIAIWIVKSGGDINSLVIERNAIADWSGLSPGVVFEGAHNGAVRDNTFRRSDTAKPVPVAYASSCGVTVSGNLAWYTAWQEPTTASCP